MTQVADNTSVKPLDKYIVVRKVAGTVEVLCETSNFNSAASYHLKHAIPGNNIYLLKNIEYTFTAKEAGR